MLTRSKSTGIEMTSNNELKILIEKIRQDLCGKIDSLVATLEEKDKKNR